MRRTTLHLSGLFACLGAMACASTGQDVQDRALEDLRQRTSAPVRTELAQVPSIPAGVTLDDGLSREEAVAIGLWNNPTFQASVGQLGFARADLVDAGMISNPTFSLLFPVGPKQLEATLRWPIEVLWERPRRVAAAQRSLEAA